MNVNNVSIRNFFFGLYILFFGLVVSLATITWLLYQNQLNLNHSHEIRYQSYLRADELRQSSDDLTRLARTYVVTKDPRYEQYYWEILAIRNGEQPRPQDYERIYWDLVLLGNDRPRPAGETESLQVLMQELGFTEEEFAKLQEAQNNSDALVKTEEIAMNAIKGNFQDESGGFSVQGEPDQNLAVTLMHDEAYHREKARIMAPIDQFFELLDNRTKLATVNYANQSNFYIQLMIGLVGVFVVALIASWLIIQRKITAPIDLLNETAQKIAVGDLTTTIRINQKDETGALANSFNVMHSYLREVAGVAQQIAQGDLTATIRPRSDQDALSYALSQMIDNLRHLIGNVTDSANQVGHASELLAGTATQASHTTGQISASIHQVSQGVQQQSEEIGQTAASVRQVSEVVDQVAQGSQAQARAISHTGQDIGDLTRAVETIATGTIEQAQAVTGA
ncbi:MAG TPA: methyl-accepting chemotaxis protein, partial [Anaerolineae bacterium]|nr:methyl-accepting chemotaxis protein [Anaerolineae bacterium]